MVAGAVQLAVRPVAARAALLVAVLPGPPEAALALARGRVADGAVVALAVEGAVEAPRVARTPLSAPWPSVPGGTPTLAVTPADAAVLAGARHIAIRAVGASRTGQRARWAEEPWATLALSAHGVTSAAVRAFAFLFAVDAVVAARASPAALATSQARGTEAVAGDRVAEGRPLALALLLALLAPLALGAVLMAL